MCLLSFSLKYLLGVLSSTFWQTQNTSTLLTIIKISKSCYSPPLANFKGPNNWYQCLSFSYELNISKEWSKKLWHRLQTTQWQSVWKGTPQIDPLYLMDQTINFRVIIWAYSCVRTIMKYGMLCWMVHMYPWRQRWEVKNQSLSFEVNRRKRKSRKFK